MDFAHANVARITGRTRAKKPVEESQPVYNRCLRFALQMVSYRFDAVSEYERFRFGSYVAASFRGSRFGSRTTLFMRLLLTCLFAADLRLQYGPDLYNFYGGLMVLELPRQ